MKRKRVEIRIIGERIKCLRMQKKLTQEEFAEEMNVSLATIKDWEQGFHYPGIDKLYEISNFFNCDLDYLFGRIEQTTHSLQDASDVTGLSIKSIKRLQEWNNNRSSYEPFTEEYIRSDIDYLNNILESFPDLLCRIDNVLTYKKLPDRYRKGLCMRVALELWNHITGQDSDLIEMGNISKFASDFVYERLFYLEEELYSKQK